MIRKGEKVVFMGLYKPIPWLTEIPELSIGKIYTLTTDIYGLGKELETCSVWITNNIGRETGFGQTFYHFELLSTIRKNKLKKLNEKRRYCNI